MSDIQTPNVKLGLDQAIDSALSELNGFTADAPEFAKIVEQLDRLYKMRAYEPEKVIVDERRVKMDTLLPILGNLAGIVAILSYEHAHVVTSKALGFVLKSRV